MRLPLRQAIFDATLVHIVNTVSPDAKWQTLRGQMCAALNKGKDERTLAILADTYASSDVIFLQEAAAATLRAELRALQHEHAHMLSRLTSAQQTAEAWEAAGVEENYWNTKARYRVEVTNASFLSHLSVGASWDGR